MTVIGKMRMLTICTKPPALEGAGESGQSQEIHQGCSKYDILVYARRTYIRDAEAYSILTLEYSKSVKS
jgi:hypothetical protein